MVWFFCGSACKCLSDNWLVPWSCILNGLRMGHQGGLGALLRLWMEGGQEALLYLICGQGLPAQAGGGSWLLGHGSDGTYTLGQQIMQSYVPEPTGSSHTRFLSQTSSLSQRFKNWIGNLEVWDLSFAPHCLWSWAHGLTL